MRPIYGKYLAGLLGLALVAAYFVNEASVGRGAFEFAYYPATPEPLPYATMRGFTYEQLWNHVSRFALLTPGLLLLSWSASLFFRKAPTLKLEPRRSARLLSALSVSLVAVLMLGVLRLRALTVDELVYSMEAQFFSEGHLQGPSIGFTLSDSFTVATAKGYTGKYLPGEALVQVLGVLLHAPPVLHLALVALTLLAFYRAVTLASDEVTAALAVAALGLAPMYLFTSATGLSHTTALACVVLAGLGYEWVRTGQHRRGATLVALALGFCAATRPQVALPAGAVVVACTVWVLVRRRALTALLLLGGLGGLSLAAIGYYDFLVTGSATKLPWFLQCIPEHYGFGQVTTFDTYRHTLLRGLENLAVVGVRFNAWWLGLPFGLGLVGLWWQLGRPARGLGIWAGVGAAVVLFELGYYAPGVSDTGPIYHFELLLPFSVLFAHTLRAACARWPTLSLAALTVHVALGWLPFVIEQAARVDREATLAHAETEALLQTVQTPALVLHETWDSERLPVGWTDTFPKRWRRQSDPIVSYPRPPAQHLAGLLRQYPGRHCYYYHRRPDTSALELIACERAATYLARGFTENDDKPPLWHESTAYRRTRFDPFAENRKRMPRDARGKARNPCCWLDARRLAGESVPADLPCLPSN